MLSAKCGGDPRRNGQGQGGFPGRGPRFGQGPPQIQQNGPRQPINNQNRPRPIGQTPPFGGAFPRFPQVNNNNPNVQPNNAGPIRPVNTPIRTV